MSSHRTHNLSENFEIAWTVQVALRPGVVDAMPIMARNKAEAIEHALVIAEWEGYPNAKALAATKDKAWTNRKPIAYGPAYY